MGRETDSVARRLSRDNPVMHFIAAGVLAVVLHMSFLMFSQAPDIKEGKIENPKYVTLLPLNTTLPSEKKLLQWMEIMDPTGVVKPDRRNGFSVAPANPFPQDVAISLKPHYTQVSKGAFSPLPYPVEKRREKVRRFWRYHSAPINPPSFAVGTKKSPKIYPLWIREDGTGLPQLFKDRKEIQNILAKQKKPIIETVLKWESNEPGYFPRVRLDVSCGNPELDHLALKTLSIRGEMLLEDYRYESDPVFIAVKWMR